MTEARKKPKINSMSVVIDRARPEDAEVLCDIRDSTWLADYPNTTLGITADDIRLNAQGPNGEFVPRRIAYLKARFEAEADLKLGTSVARIGDKVVGYVDAVIDESGQKRLSAIYVAPDAQAKGIGGRLMRQALDMLGTDADVYLDVVSYNMKAIGFYEHFGFVKTDKVVPEEKDRPAYLTSLPQIEMVLRAT